MTYIEHFLRSGLSGLGKKKDGRETRYFRQKVESAQQNVFWYVVGRAKDVQGTNEAMRNL